MSLGVTLAVLGAGLLHAGWNALLKSSPGGDVLLDTASVVAGAALCAFAVLPFLPPCWASSGCESGPLPQPRSASH